MEHILELYYLNKRYLAKRFCVKIVDLLVEHKLLTKISDKYIFHITILLLSYGHFTDESWWYPL
jgi:hypothetical protein